MFAVHCVYSSWSFVFALTGAFIPHVIEGWMGVGWGWCSEWFVSAARQLMNEVRTISFSVLSLWLMMMDLFVSALLFLFRMKD